MRHLFKAGLLACALGLAGGAQAAPGVEIRNAIARVTVIPEARSDVAVFVVRANPRLPLRISRMGDTVVVDGGLGWRSPNCRRLFGRPAAYAFGVGSVPYGDMPQIVVRSPLAARVGAGGAVFGAVGPGAGLDLANSGCGDWTVADQSGPLRLSLAGSGDVRAGAMATAEAHVSGSSDVTLRQVRNGLTAAVSGSGDLKSGSVDGPLRLRITGSGDVVIRSGAVADMAVSVAGSGDVKFGGVAQSLSADVAGSGDVRVAKVTGAVVKHVAGSGEVTVGR